MSELTELQAERAVVEAAMVVELAALADLFDYQRRDVAGVLGSSIVSTNKRIGGLRARAFALDVEMAWVAR